MKYTGPGQFATTGRGTAPAKEAVGSWIKSSDGHTRDKWATGKEIVALVRAHALTQAATAPEITTRSLNVYLRAHQQLDKGRFEFRAGRGKGRSPAWKIAAPKSSVRNALPRHKVLIDRRKLADLELDAGKWRALEKRFSQPNVSEFPLTSKVCFLECFAICPALSRKQFPRIASMIVLGALLALGLGGVVSN